MVSSDSEASGTDSSRHGDRDRKRRKYDTKDGDDKHKKTSSSSSSSRKHDKDRDSSRSKKSHKKSHKKDRKKESKSKKSKKEKKHKKKRKHSDSDSSKSDSDSSSDSSSSSRSRSRSRSRSHSRKHHSSSSSTSAAAPPPQPPPAATSITRALGLVDTLLTHGGGDRAVAGREVQFLLFKLDSGSNVNVEAIGDPLVKHILSTLFREMGLKVKIDPATGEEGWMSPVDSKGRVAYKLCDLLSDAFKTEAEKQAEKESKINAASSIGPSMPPPRDSSTSSGSVEAASSAARVVGPAMPNAEDFDRMARGETAPLAEDADEEEGGNFGPRLPEQMTDQERVAFDRLRASREQLASLRTAVKEGERTKDGGREEWMTAMPTFDNSMPSTAVIAALAASGDRDAMKGRGFATKNADRTVVQDDDWALSPAERARKDAERAAIRQAEKAVYQSSMSAGGKGGDFSTSGDRSAGRGRESANASAAAAQAANDRMMARYKTQQTLTSNSLMAQYQKEEDLKRTKDKSKPDGLFRWDHDKEMGMRGIKGKEALKKELNSAYQLNDNFAPAGGQ